MTSPSRSVGHGDVEAADRLEHHRARPWPWPPGTPSRPAARNAISELSTLCSLPSTSVDPHVDDRVAVDAAAGHRLLDALGHGGDVAAADRAADDLVDELEALASLERLDLGCVATANWPWPPDCFLCLPSAVGRPADRLAVADLHVLGGEVDAELPLEALEGDGEVRLARCRAARSGGSPRRGRRRGRDPRPGGGGARWPACRRRPASWRPRRWRAPAPAARSGRRGPAGPWGRACRRWRCSASLATPPMSPAASSVDGLVVLAPHHEQAVEPLVGAGAAVHEVVVVADRAGQHLEQRDLAHERVGDRLEHDRRAVARRGRPAPRPRCRRPGRWWAGRRAADRSPRAGRRAGRCPPRRWPSRTPRGTRWPSRCRG